MYKLQVKLGTLVYESKLIRRKERHYLTNARALSGRYVKKHRKGEERPAKPEKVLRAEAIENAVDKAREDYEKFWGLEHHRKHVLRKEARDTHLALNFLRGREFKECEIKRYTDPDFDNIQRMIIRLGGLTKDYMEQNKTIQRFEEWVQSAKKITKGVNFIEF